MVFIDTNAGYKNIKGSGIFIPASEVFGSLRKILSINKDYTIYDILRAVNVRFENYLKSGSLQ